jgi:cyclopropane fatty-acyl-phospholipid synthase-like methyltransferase
VRPRGWHASDYFRQSGLQQATAEEQLGQLTLQGGERVLDVGCGDGTITAEIAACGDGESAVA